MELAIVQGKLCHCDLEPEETEVVVPEHVTSIGANAFALQMNLKRVQLPATLVSIAEAAFYGCTALEEITLNYNIRISKNAFAKCASIRKITLLSVPGSEKIPLREKFIADFSDSKKSIRELIIPDGVREIGKEAFRGCSNLEQVTLPSTLKKMAASVFRDCAKLKSVSLHDGIRLGLGVFRGCKSLSEPIYSVKGKTLYFVPEDLEGEFVMPDQVQTTVTGIFSRQKKLEKVVWSGRCPVIPESAFTACTALQEVVIPEGVRRIDKFAFSECTALTIVALPATMQELRPNVFEHCRNLTRVTIPGGKVKMCQNVFWDCPALEEDSIPEQA